MSVSLDGFGAPGPLCTQGRCAAILTAIAAAKTLDGLAKQYGAALTDVIKGVLADFGVQFDDEQVRAAIARHIQLVTGVERKP